MRNRNLISLTLVLLLLGGCASNPPAQLNNICAIFSERPAWYEASKDSLDRWGVPIHIQMAIIYQESRFNADAKPDRVRFLGIPLYRRSSAYGYAQVKDGTWDHYIDKTGNRGADRDDFEDAVDFIGWYGALASRTLGISKWNAYQQYLAYHEGHGGYKRKTYNKKPWLKSVARKLEIRAKRYSEQLWGCRERLDSGSWWWPF